MAIGTWVPFDISNLDPKFQINWTKNNFAKGLKQKPAAKCCRSAKFGDAQAKQGRDLTASIGQNFRFKTYLYIRFFRPHPIELK